MRWTLGVLGLVGCAGPEALELPSDPSEPGVPVGVVTVEAGEQTLEVWYPASDDTEGEAEVLQLTDFLPGAFLEVVPELDPPGIPTRAVRDAPPRRLEDPVPVILFSHGFGGFRSQSVDLTSHLASRGYVVVAADHPGRSLADIAGCLLTSTSDLCGLSLDMSTDPAVEDLADARAWVETDPEVLGGLADPATLGVFGHSAGGGTTTEIANTWTGVGAALAMAGGGALEVEMPSLLVGGRCDAIVPESSLVGAGPTWSEGYLSMPDVGHLAFSDLCEVDLGAFAAQLEARDDANTVLLRTLSSLATDGCPGYAPDPELAACGDAFAPLEPSYATLRALVTTFFDEHLKGADPVDAGALEGVEPLEPTDTGA